MCQEERLFYEKLREYLEDGFDLARRQGNQGRALGFLMAIFQKIAASSFAAVRRTLKRRLLMLTLHEALLRDRELDIEGRERLTNEARDLIHEQFGLARDSKGRSEVERVLADLRFRLVKKLDEEALEMASDPYGSEYSSIHAEDAVAAAVDLHLPEERMRIGDLLKSYPQQRETKAQKLLDGLGTLWRQNPGEKIVVFATYLGTVDLIAREIDQTYPGQGVVVLRGGDHGAKVAAERRFRQKDGPRVLVCTAAGREGINLQFARVLFNFDLPWNPMDVEQRIGRIHRYGQNHTAQVYNLVLSDTIEGRIFLLLDDKLTEIARTVGKVDEQGNVAEDLRAQILGQLSERLNYDRLYQEALSDPELKRTKVELEAALSNSHEARQVVFDLFQDLAGFSLDDYKPFSDVSSSLDRLVRFMSGAVAERKQRMVKVGEGTFDLWWPRPANTSPVSPSIGTPPRGRSPWISWAWIIRSCKRNWVAGAACRQNRLVFRSPGSRMARSCFQSGWSKFRPATERVAWSFNPSPSGRTGREYRWWSGNANNIWVCRLPRRVSHQRNDWTSSRKRWSRHCRGNSSTGVLRMAIIAMRQS